MKNEKYRFFEKHIKLLRGKRCSECGTPLLGDVSEVAHRLNKSYFKSISCNDSNVVYLCSWKSVNNCHGRYDGSNEDLQKLKIFNTERVIIMGLLKIVSEEINWKIRERWLI